MSKSKYIRVVSETYFEIINSDQNPCTGSIDSVLLGKETQTNLKERSKKILTKEYLDELKLLPDRPYELIKYDNKVYKTKCKWYKEVVEKWSNSKLIPKRSDKKRYSLSVELPYILSILNQVPGSYYQIQSNPRKFKNLDLNRYLYVVNDIAKHYTKAFGTPILGGKKCPRRVYKFKFKEYLYIINVFYTLNGIGDICLNKEG